MKKYALIIVAFMSVFATTAMAETIKGSKNIITKDVALETFVKVKSAANVDVVFVQQEGPAKATILTADNVMDYVTTAIADGTLTVGIKDGVIVSAKKLEVTVTAPAVCELECAGSGDIKCAAITADDFTATLSGKGDMDVKKVECKNACTVNLTGAGDMDLGNVHCEDFVSKGSGNGDVRVGKLTGTNAKSEISGTGSIDISGKVKFVDFNVTGDGSINASMLQAENGEAHNTGSGSINAHVYGHLESRNMGGGINNSK